MLGWLFSHWRKAGQQFVTRVPEGTRVYAIGDIHGRVDLLDDLHAMIRLDATNAPGRRVVVYLGDYIDRGLHSSSVVDLLLDHPLDGFESIHLKGNHEAALLDFLNNSQIGANWLQFGGGATLLSYHVGLQSHKGAMPDFAGAQREFLNKLPARHLEFFRGLALTYEQGDYLFVHAGIRPMVALGQQSAEDLLWIRDEFLYFTGDFGRMVVHGHTITEEPEVCNNRIGIDTGAFATSRLTCLVLEGSERRFLST